jgi:6,7-dimethyl-8-ribityllumazine synthase
MATAGKNLSAFDPIQFQNCADFRIGIVVSEWNGHITERLLAGALAVLSEIGHDTSKVYDHYDGIVAIGVVIQGETKHFDFVCNGATNGLMDVMLKYNKPVGFCLLTDNNEQQSLDRAGGQHGNKGTEAMVAVLQMLQIQKGLRS